MINWRIQGLMLTGHFVLLDGHIYHKNEIYKVRYDLIGKVQNMT